MIAFLLFLILLAMAFGAGAVLEGLLWALLVAIVLLAAAVFVGWRKFRGATRSITDRT